MPMRDTEGGTTMLIKKVTRTVLHEEDGVEITTGDADGARLDTVIRVRGAGREPQMLTLSASKAIVLAKLLRLAEEARDA